MNLKYCDFCRIIAGKAPAKIEHEWDDAIAIHTNRPKAPGHLLVIPRQHVQDANEDPYIAGRTLMRAAEIAKPPCHIHTNLGGAAAQTIFHLHFHVLPRVPGQEVELSWFKPWRPHPYDRDPKKTQTDHGVTFSSELRIFGKSISARADVNLFKNIKKIFD